MHVARPSADLSARSLPKPAATPPAGATGGFGSSLKPAATPAADAAEAAPAAAASVPPKPDLASSLSTVSLAAATTPRQSA